jgi:hypothetical protein
MGRLSCELLLLWMMTTFPAAVQAFYRTWSDRKAGPQSGLPAPIKTPVRHFRRRSDGGVADGVVLREDAAALQALRPGAGGVDEARNGACAAETQKGSCWRTPL